MGWSSITEIGSRNFTCGHCGKPIASEKGYFHSTKEQYVYICHFCDKPTYLIINPYNEIVSQVPGTIFGDEVEGIDDENIKMLYNESRRSMSCGTYTGAIMCCRKLLMHIAVSKGASEGQNFIEYVEYLANNNYVPPGSKDWVDHIRKKGNEANHEIVIMKKEDAEEIISFSAMLLKVIYEFPSRIRKKTTT